MNSIDNLISEFIGKDELRPVMMKACLSGEYILATDAHMGIMVPVVYTEKEYTKIEKYPDLEGVIKGQNIKETPQIVNIEVIENTLSLMPKVDKYEECPQCEGQGIIECHCCSHDYDCEECHGKGETKNIIGKGFAEYDYVKINDCYYSPNYIQKIVTACKAHEVNEFSILCQKPNTGLLAKVKGTIIILMPIMFDSHKNKAYDVFKQSL